LTSTMRLTLLHIVPPVLFILHFLSKICEDGPACGWEFFLGNSLLQVAGPAAPLSRIDYLTCSTGNISWLGSVYP